MAIEAEKKSVFKEARLKAELSVEDVAAQLNIRKKYIIALEEGDYTEIPAKVYIKGYMKMYSKLLGIEFPESADQDLGTLEPMNFRKNVARRIINSPRLNHPLFSKVILFLCAFMLFAAYYLYFYYYQ